MNKPDTQSRDYSEYATPAVRNDLNCLLREEASPEGYRAAMIRLGGALAGVVRSRISPGEDFAVVTPPEDADYLTSGLLEKLPRRKAHLVCYWTTRHKLGNRDVATVNQSFVDPSMPSRVDTVVIVKSIIATGCVVRTNLEAFLSEVEPRQVLVVAPVVLDGAMEDIKREFSREVASRFAFIWFAKDNVRNANNIVEPGVGGWVEERLGFDVKSPRRISPALINTWRQRERRGAGLELAAH